MTAPTLDRTVLPCASTDPDVFFPHENDRDGINQAKWLCLGCPMQAPCLERAIARDERFGVWGGKSTADRDAIRGGRMRTCPACHVPFLPAGRESYCQDPCTAPGAERRNR